METVFVISAPSFCTQTRDEFKIFHYILVNCTMQETKAHTLRHAITWTVHPWVISQPKWSLFFEDEFWAKCEMPTFPLQYTVQLAPYAVNCSYCSPFSCTVLSYRGLNLQNSLALPIQQCNSHPTVCSELYSEGVNVSDTCPRLDSMCPGVYARHRSLCTVPRLASKLVYRGKCVYCLASQTKYVSPGVCSALCGFPGLLAIYSTGGKCVSVLFRVPD